MDIFDPIDSKARTDITANIIRIARLGEQRTQISRVQLALNLQGPNLDKRLWQDKCFNQDSNKLSDIPPHLVSRLRLQIIREIAFTA
jgi:hypothetical protein